MESELPSQRNCFAGCIPQTFGMLKLGQNNLWNGTKAAFYAKQLFALTTGLKIKGTVSG